MWWLLAFVALALLHFLNAVPRQQAAVLDEAASRQPCRPHAHEEVKRLCLTTSEMHLKGVNQSLAMSFLINRGSGRRARYAAVIVPPQ